MKTGYNPVVLKFRRSLFVLLLELLEMIIPLSLVYCFLRFANLWSAFSLPLGAKELAWGYRILCALCVLEIARRYYNDLFVLGHRRIVHFHGLISFRFRRISICYTDIREIKVRQSILGRIFGYGFLKFGTAATAEEEIIFRDIVAPKKLSRFVERLAYAKSNSAQSSEAAGVPGAAPKHAT